MRTMKTIALLIALAALLCAGGAAAQDDEAIRATVLNYLEGWFGSDAERMEKALHPSLFKCRVQTLRGTDAEILDTVDASTLITYAGHNQAWVEGKVGFKEMDIIYQDGRIAVVHAVSGPFYDVIGLVKMNGEWKILQVLWDANPPTE